ncbi:unnamed protein product [Prorocentrum cordatum]|uniref:Uncharacterized protein n=1 Tax=Prorocentrum cordatum TaxID=2364126 RepID=A0ABN9T3G8_9DINO|nr:unnamed protein product [Polarella glacialis]
MRGKQRVVVFDSGYTGETPEAPEAFAAGVRGAVNKLASTTSGKPWLETMEPYASRNRRAADDIKAVEERCQRQLEELRSALEGTGEEPGLKAAVSSIRQDVDALREALTQQVEELRSSLEQRYAQAEQQVLEAMQLNGRLAEAASESHAHALQVSFRADAQKALLEEAARPVGGMSEEERAALEARLRALEATRGAGVSEQEREGLFARVRALEAQLEEGIEMGMTRTGTTTDGKRNLGVQVRQAVLEINMLDERLNALEAAADSDSAWPVRQEPPARGPLAALQEKLADLGTPTASGGFSFGLGAQDGGDLLTSLRARILALGEEQEEQESRVSRLQEQLSNEAADRPGADERQHQEEPGRGAQRGAPGEGGSGPRSDGYPRRACR